MNWRTITMSDRFARYFFTLVVGNNIFGLFLTLSMFRANGIPFFSHLLIVLAIAHTTALLCLGCIDIAYWLLSRRKTHPSSALILVATVIGVVLVPALYVGSRAGVYVARMANIPWRANFVDIVRPGFLFGVLVCGLAIAFVQWLKNMKDHYEQRAALMLAERRLLQARFDLLAKELHPHLLFNVIQNVMSLMTQNVGAAKKMLEELAVYYQGVLLVIDKHAITFAEEVSLCRHFMALQQSRYKFLELIISDNTKGGFNEFLLPPLLLQPILENAVKYTINNEERIKTIHITVGAQDDALHIVITNPHSDTQRHTKPGFSKGLKNCEHRMKDFFGENARLTLSQEQDVTRVNLDLPYDK